MSAQSRIRLSLYCLLLLLRPAFAGEAVQKPSHFQQKMTTMVSLDYLTYIPQLTNQPASKKLPTILFLHGSGERGTNVWDVTRHGPPKILKDQGGFPFIVISPQCPPGEQWDARALYLLIKDLKKRYPIDPDRLYLTGLSMGGTGAWNLFLQHPTLFAAVVPVCGRADTNSLPYLDATRVEQLKHVPIWAFHGAKDPEVPLARSVNMTKALKELGCNINLTIYPEAMHDSWTQTYANPDLYAWLLSHDRKNHGFKGLLE